MHYFVYVAVIKIAITNSMNVHKVLDNCVPHGKSALHLLVAVLIVGHFESVFTLRCQRLCYFWCVFVKNAMSLVFPVEVR